MTDELPIDTVRRFCAAWGTEDLDTIIGFFTDDAVYHNIPLAPVVGPEQIKATIEGFSGGVESIEFRLDAIAADGATVLTERLRHLHLRQRPHRPAGHGHLRGPRRQDRRLARLLRHGHVPQPDARA